VRDVPAPDVMTVEPAHAVDARRVRDDPRRAARASSPASRWAWAARSGRTEATGYGVVFTLREALKELGIRPRRYAPSVQGFGNVSQYAIELYLQLGGTVTCVSCWDQADQCSYAFRKEGGVDLVQLRGITDRFGGMDKHKAEELGYEVLPATPGSTRRSRS
jgi:glutamate dehydrogenase